MKLLYENIGCDQGKLFCTIISYVAFDSVEGNTGTKLATLQPLVGKFADHHENDEL